MKCKKCKIQRDPNSGMMICINCGKIHEESQIVEALEFDENQNAVGTLIDVNKPSYFFPGGRNTLSQMDSKKRNLLKVFKKIERTAKILSIPDDTVQYAKALYKEAIKQKFTQGRKTSLIVGAILYLACRFKKKGYLLIDFSEVLSINLFVIGIVYIKLAKLLNIELESGIIDPSIHIHRFCNKFNFGNKTKEVQDTALKILQFMERDWITYGRRPSGLYGACILISAKLNKMNIDINDISKVVHVCNQTILNRIDEFSLTRVASMTIEEFKSFKESHFYPGADPPAFLKGLKEKKKQEEIKNEEDEKKEESKEEIENNQNNDDNNNNDVFSFKQTHSGLNKNNNELLTLKGENSGLNNINNNESDNFTFRQVNSGISQKDSYFYKEVLNLRSGNSGISKNNELLPSNSGISKKIDNNLSLRQNNSGISQSFRINELKPTSSADEKLSNIPDNEDYKYIYNKDEYAVRKQFWEIMFKDWIEQQKEKEEKELKENKTKTREPKKRIKKTIFKSDGSQRTPEEAIKSSNKIFSKKMNFSYIKSMMSKKKK